MTSEWDKPRCLTSLPHHGRPVSGSSIVVFSSLLLERNIATEESYGIYEEGRRQDDIFRDGRERRGRDAA
ncbi:hypothetical protein Trydic_g18484 [Trypoxylus dichotomus]